jgi:soluble lytic murein transglycosylase-like protein
MVESLMRFLVPLILCAGAAYAGEYAVLASGSRLHIDRHEKEGTLVKLYTTTGTIEMPADRVSAFEPEDHLSGVESSKAPAADAKAPTSASPQELADDAARKYGLPRELVRSVMKAESAFQPQALSPKGAIGLMQLTPATAETLGVNPNDPAQNVDAGTRYLRQLLEKYHGGLWHALAAYNAGPGAVDRFGGVPPYAETLEYVRRVQRGWKPDY